MPSTVSNIALGAGKKRILVLCGNDHRGISVANIYAEMLADHELIFLEEKVLSPGRIKNFVKRRLKSKGFLSLLGSLLYYAMLIIRPENKPKRRYKARLVVGNFSKSDAVEDLIREFKPDAALVAFCGLLDDELLELLPHATYNIHPGINPRYRGFGNIWALYENETELLGYTIHKVDKGIDTGEPVAVKKLGLRSLAVESFSDIDLPVASLAARHLAGLLLGQREAEIPSDFAALDSRMYGVPTLSVFWRARKNYLAALARAPRHILITGASGGIGRALAEKFAAPGVRLSLWGRDKARLEEAAAACRGKGAESFIIQQDLRELEKSRELLASLDKEHPVDLAIIGSGVTSGTLSDGSPEPVADACRTMNINASAAINMGGALLELMRPRGTGQVAFISSVASLYPLPDSPAYSAAKVALAYYARAMRPLVRPLQLSIIYPGYVDSPMSRRLDGAQPMRWSAPKAAAYICKKLDKGKRRIVFPKLLALGTLLLNFLPSPVAEFFLKRFAFVVLPSEEPQSPDASPAEKNNA